MKESLNLRLLLAKEQFKKWTYGNKQNELFWDNVENKINKYIFECAFKGAYKDITLRTIKGVGQVKNLRQLCFDNLKELFNNYFTNKAPSTKEEFDNIHNIMCLNFLQAFNQALTNCNLPEQKYGKAQKIVNMLFKNLYCADIKEKKEYFTFCHMPIDSYILKWYFRDLAAKIKITKFKTCWSNLDFATYISVQNNIRDYLCEFGEKANLPNIVLEAEYCIWENEKNN